MKSHDDPAAKLRAQAEASLQGLAHAPADGLSAEAQLRLLHELEVHQIELELQNDELRSTQARLEDSQARYLELFEFAPVGYITVSIEHALIQKANLGAAALLGRSTYELVGRALNSYIDPQDRDQYYLLIKRLDKPDADRTCELRLLRPDGSPVWVQLTATAAPEAATAPEWLITLSDISRRRQVEEQLGRSRDQLSAVLENLAEGVVIATMDGEVIHWNDAGLKIWGLTNLAEVQRDITAFRGLFQLSTLDGTQLPLDQWPLPRVIRGEPVLNLELNVCCVRLPETAVVVFNGAIVRDPSGIQLAYLIFQDITARKRVEIELHRRTLELQARNSMLERFNQITEGRELRMIELKGDIDKLCVRLGEPPRYHVIERPELASLNRETL